MKPVTFQVGKTEVTCHFDVNQLQYGHNIQCFLGAQRIAVYYNENGMQPKGEEPKWIVNSEVHGLRATRKFLSETDAHHCCVVIAEKMLCRMFGDNNVTIKQKF